MQERKRQAYEQKQREIEEAISKIDMEFSDEAGWNKFVEVNSDGYGSGVVRYAERWAKLMQVRMAKGQTIADMAEETSRDADNEGITVDFYGCAVRTLAQTWKHGKALRLWHNKETQIGNEGDEANKSGGVLNPALLAIKTKQELTSIK